MQKIKTRERIGRKKEQREGRSSSGGRGERGGERRGGGGGETKVKKRALGLSGKAATEEREGRSEGWEREADERKSRVVRHKRNSFGDTGTSPSLPSPPRSLVSSFLLSLVSSSPPSLFWPRDPARFFTGLWDFFHADRQVVHQRGLTVSLVLSLFLRRVLSDSGAFRRRKK